MTDDLHKDAELFLRQRNVYLGSEPSVVCKDGYYENLVDLLVEFAAEIIKKSTVNG